MRIPSPCTPRDLAVALAAILGPAAAVAGLVEAAERLRSRPDLISSVLTALYSCPSQLERLARVSTWHENGFAKIRLLAHHGFTLRLHIWPPGDTRSGDTNPHGHRWDFASWVAVGEGLLETFFTESHAGEANAESYNRYEYGVSDELGSLQHVGSTWLLQQSQEARHSAGTVYPCRRDRLHKVGPIGDQLVATLVLRGPKRANTATVFMHPERPSDPPQRSILVSELSDLLIKVDGAITQSERTTSLAGAR